MITKDTVFITEYMKWHVAEVQAFYFFKGFRVVIQWQTH